MKVSVVQVHRVKAAVEALLGVDSKTWPRQIKKLNNLLQDAPLSEILTPLKAKADLDQWLASLSRRGIGGGSLNWPDDADESLGLALNLIEYCAADPERAGPNIAHSLFANRSFSDDLRDFANAIVVPFYNELAEYLQDKDFIEAEAATAPTRAPVTNRVFLVHGRDGASKNEVARFLEKIGLDVIILHERPNKGRTLITKFQEESADVTFAVVLITPDDTGGLSSEETRPRARQNVIFELGFFIGKLGQDRVCALMTPSVEKPSDYDGVAYVPLDETGGWRAELVRELAAARVPVDFAKAFT